MSLKTDNYKLYKYEDNDIGDLRFINDSMDIIDKGINPFYVATQSSTNVYKVTTGLNKTSLANGYSIKVAIPSNSAGAVSITVDSVTVPVKKPNGGAVTNFKANGVYSLTYYNSVFILASGAGCDTVNFTSDKLLTGYSANDSNGEKVNGTMPNKGTSTNTLGLNGSLTLPSGYYDSIKVTQSITTRGSTTDAKSQGVNGDYIYTRIPQGAYFTNASFGYPEIKSKFADIASAIGLTADKLVAGNTIGGITGTYKSINDIWAYTPGTITLPSERENTTIVSIPFEPSIIMGFCMTETGKHYSATNPTGGDIRWGVGNGRFFKIMSGSYAFKHVDITQNRTCIQDVTYSNGKLTIYSKGSYGGSDYRYTFMIIAIR